MKIEKWLVNRLTSLVLFLLIIILLHPAFSRQTKRFLLSRA